MTPLEKNPRFLFHAYMLVWAGTMLHRIFTAPWDGWWSVVTLLAIPLMIGVVVYNHYYPSKRLPLKPNRAIAAAFMVAGVIIVAASHGNVALIAVGVIVVMLGPTWLWWLTPISGP